MAPTFAGNRPNLQRASRANRSIRLDPATWLTLKRCLVLADALGEASTYDELLRPMLRHKLQHLRRVAKDRGIDPDEALKVAESGSAPDLERSGAGFSGVPVKSARVDE